MEPSEHNPGEMEFGEHAEDAPHNPGEQTFSESESAGADREEHPRTADPRGDSPESAPDDAGA